jgi:hypothetical protein
MADSVGARWPTCPSTTSARPGPAQALEVAGAGGAATNNWPSWCPWARSSARSRRSRARHRPARGHAGARRGRRQGLRDARFGRPGAHIGALSYGTTATINQTSARYLEAVRLRSAVSGSGARPLQRGGADHARLLAGELVQGAVRPARARSAQAARHCARAAVRRMGRATCPRRDGPDAAADLEPRHPRARAPKPRAPSSALARCTPVPTCTEPSSRAWPTACAKGANASSAPAARDCRPSRQRRRRAKRCRAAAQLPTCSACRWPGPHTHETSGLGAAIDCAVGLGLHADMAQAVAG